MGAFLIWVTINWWVHVIWTFNGKVTGFGRVTIKITDERFFQQLDIPGSRSLSSSSGWVRWPWSSHWWMFAPAAVCFCMFGPLHQLQLPTKLCFPWSWLWGWILPRGPATASIAGTRRRRCRRGWRSPSGTLCHFCCLWMPAMRGIAGTDEWGQFDSRMSTARVGNKKLQCHHQVSCDPWSSFLVLLIHVG